MDRSSPSSQSASLLVSVLQFDFVLSLTVTAAVVALDLHFCYEMVEKVIKTLEKYRETKFEEIYQEALNVFLPFSDFVLGQLKSRFSKNDHSSIFDLFTLIPSSIVKTTNLTAVVAAARVYSCDLPHPFSLSREITLWKELWSGREHLPQTAAEARQEANEIFPNVKILLQVLATIPVSTCSVERSLSSLKQFKTYLRTTMTEDRLNGLAAMYTHWDISRDLQPLT
ncbi:hypothetical protein RN001_013352 [Aquatica leii]|uniref:HAT C-terminal dimerisation domain-containing protein n=1 Tax=Aquatica leii TaxID=1421715 RepID=A0AAN7SCC9_9COLE|nr:hypothetical protein RN001_013352 [Aquatica leii]